MQYRNFETRVALSQVWSRGNGEYIEYIFLLTAREPSIAEVLKGK